MAISEYVAAIPIAAPDPAWLLPAWPAPARVRALITTRAGGVSVGPYASMNPADHVGDDARAVMLNRARLRAALPAAPVWLTQVHGVDVHRIEPGQDVRAQADASVTTQAHRICAVLTADCLPVLLCDAAGTVVAAAHAGWRGLCAGVIERSVAAMAVPGESLLAYLGPAIGPRSFEVGAEVRAAFTAVDSAAASAFVPIPGGKYLADLYHLARQRLQYVGVTQVFGGEFCTLREAERFFSYRRDGATGRMASLIWLEPAAR